MLEQSLDIGLKEYEFWEMTPAEIIRAIESYNRVIKRQTKEKATHDYILAGLIVKGVSITLGGKSKFPTIQEAYPSIFDEDIEAHREQQREQTMNLSALRFKQFAQSYNSKFRGKEVQDGK